MIDDKLTEEQIYFAFQFQGIQSIMAGRVQLQDCEADSQKASTSRSRGQISEMGYKVSRSTPRDLLLPRSLLLFQTAPPPEPVFKHASSQGTFHIQQLSTCKAEHDSLCNTSTREAEAGGSRVKGQSLLHSEFKTHLGFLVRHCYKQKNNPKPKCV